jgi:hypothetical protein
MTLDPYLILILIPHLSSGCGTRSSFARQPPIVSVRRIEVRPGWANRHRANTLQMPAMNRIARSSASTSASGHFPAPSGSPARSLRSWDQ